MNIDDSSPVNTRSSSSDDLLTPASEETAVTLPIQKSVCCEPDEDAELNDSLSNSVIQ